MRLLVLSLTACLLALAAPAQAQTIGFNQGWIDGKYGRDLSSAFDAQDWARVLRKTRASGGTALRVWLFEGQRKEGLVWGSGGKVSVDPTFLANVRTLIQLAKQERVQIYWTALSGNWASNWATGTVHSNRHYNLLNDRYKTGAHFRKDVLGPVVDAIMAEPGVAWGLDLMNEVQGSVKAWFWSDGWRGARRFVKTTAAFVKARAPRLRVTASSGHHTAVSDVLAGRFDALGLDVFDVHTYSDTPGVPRARALARHARAQGVKLVVGEYGQKTKRYDQLLQAQVTYGVLRDTYRYGFLGSFAWRLEDNQPGGLHFSYYDGARPRYAVAITRWFAGFLRRQRATRGRR